MCVSQSVLGSQLTMSAVVKQRAAAPSQSEAFVDPAGLPYIRSGPAGAGGAAGAIYRHIGIGSDPAFPQPVQDGIQAEGDAKFHCYQNQHNVIHTVGPDLRVGNPTWEHACDGASPAAQL